MPILETIQNNLNYYIGQNNITKWEFSKRLGTTAATVTMWCNGTTTPTPDKYDDICRVLRITPAVLVSERTATDENTVVLSDNEKRLFSGFLKLNDKGQERLMEQLNFLLNSANFSK